jgi:hypothetical protein
LNFKKGKIKYLQASERNFVGTYLFVEGLTIKNDEIGEKILELNDKFIGCSCTEISVMDEVRRRGGNSIWTTINYSPIIQQITRKNRYDNTFTGNFHFFIS